jgi:uncharacterized membrane protein YphA (DoxX/SURF4 family)
MQRLFSTFPNRWPGLGILLLRSVVGSAVILQSVDCLKTTTPQDWQSLTLAAIAIMAGCLLIAGLLTPLACVFLITCCALDAVVRTPGSCHPSTGTLIQTLISAVAIALLGPGAFSFDSRLFGRREIIIPGTDSPYRTD